MSGYVLRRLVAIGALAFGISLLVFLIIRLIPGDPAVVLLGTNAGDPELIARLHQQLGLDRSIPVQYFVWLGNVLRGDFGYSYGQQQSVASLVAENMPATIQLTVASLAVSLLLGSAIGVFAAARRNRFADTAAMGVALAFLSIPSFWLGLLLILLFAVQLPWFDVVGGTSLKGLVLPAATLALGTAGFNARFVRSSVVQALTQRYVLTARAKGLWRGQVFRRHVLRNALLPVLTVAGLQVGQLLSGTVVVETVFSRPGIGRLLVQSILAKDYLTVQAVVLIIAILYALCNFAVDLLYPLLDPRVGAVTLDMLRHRSLAAGLVIAGVIVLMVLAAPLLTSADPNAQDPTQSFSPPSAEHLMGADAFGRDMFARVLYGGRTTMAASLGVVVLGGIAGTALGLIAGYAGGVVRFAIMRLVDLMLAFPGILLALAVSAVLGPGLDNGVLAIAVVLTPIYARLVEGATAEVRHLPYVDAAVTLGAGAPWVILRHILPNVSPGIIVLTTTWLGIAVLWIAALGFIGVGVQPPLPEWGAILNDGQNYITLAWWITVFPGVFLALLVIGVNLIGDGLRDQLDPTLSRL